MEERHIRAFGYFISKFAQIEAGFSYYIAEVMGISHFQSSVLTAPYNASTWTDVIKSVANHVDENVERSLSVIEIMESWEAQRPLRNKIAHAMWTTGAEEGALKPMGIRVRGGRVRLSGHQPDDWELSFAALEDACVQLDEIHGRFIAAMKQWAIWQEVENDNVEGAPE